MWAHFWRWLSSLLLRKVGGRFNPTLLRHNKFLIFRCKVPAKIERVENKRPPSKFALSSSIRWFRFSTQRRQIVWSNISFRLLPVRLASLRKMLSSSCLCCRPIDLLSVAPLKEVACLTPRRIGVRASIVESYGSSNLSHRMERAWLISQVTLVIISIFWFNFFPGFPALFDPNPSSSVVCEFLVPILE